jgi:hypothetical protein
VSAFLNQVTDQLNLRWAWEKVNRQAVPGDYWFDDVELAAFDSELDRNLRSLAIDIGKGRYRLTALRPLPFPKDADPGDSPRVRQVFQVSVRDQVAWTAVVNIVGPYVDKKMPAWSYGNRLFRSIWVETEKDGSHRRRIGQYRHAAGNLYLPFGQSWPVFRRHAHLTTRAMSLVDDKAATSLDEATQEELDLQRWLDEEHRCPFVVPEYWQKLRPGGQIQNLYWCGIDLKKFYPSLNLNVVRENIVKFLLPDWKADANRLLASMLTFPLDLRQWTPDDLGKMDLRPKQKTFKHVPTGLNVAGFLANAGLLGVDLEVQEHLKRQNVAHFRFVDDHIVLAYTFNELVQWVQEYINLLQNSGTGVRVNREKFAPPELAPLIVGRARQKVEKQNMPSWQAAEKACHLDPRFPSPLMTKTLALISAIARTDFDLLESEELVALTDQLEHLLLVELPDEEIQEKTRLSFAATRLTRIAECRLANPEVRIQLTRQREALLEERRQLRSVTEKRVDLEAELEDVTKRLARKESRLAKEIERAFQLLRKVLNDRPDRTRLWTRAILMCRLTGVRGLGDLLADIRRETQKNPLAGEYLYANFLSLVGKQLLTAARTFRDEGAANWRRQAAHDFLADASSTMIPEPNRREARWFLVVSYLQYCFGSYCADLILKDGVSKHERVSGLSSRREVLAIAKRCLKVGAMDHAPAQWVWWAGRMTLRELDPHAIPFVKRLGEKLRPSKEVSAFWRFFPLDVPTTVLGNMLAEGNTRVDLIGLGGWWVDALRNRDLETISSLVHGDRQLPARVRRLLTSKRSDLSLYEWCDKICELSGDRSSDPRAGEWTAVEIVRQVASLVSVEPTFGAKYISDAKETNDQQARIHPANFRIPKEWLEGKDLTWEQWRMMVRRSEKQVIFVPETDRIRDNRYTPLRFDSPLFLEINRVRGLGLLLYGLLRKSFDLPAMWNGPGHADVLAMLPKVLLAEVTCSSWTLGVLAGCLQSRATENIYLRRFPLSDYTFFSDMLHDPLVLINPESVSKALKKCQDELQLQQLSTMNQSARQLTPVSIRQLTEPQWSKDFDFPATAERDVHE